MKVRDAMSRNVQLIGPDQTIQEAAYLMAEIDVGALPVGRDDRLVGMITDRDIAVRAVAVGQGPETTVREVMSARLRYCFENDELGVVAANMGELQVRRLPVVNVEKRLVGIITISDVADVMEFVELGKAMARISEPGGRHCQPARSNLELGHAML